MVQNAGSVLRNRQVEGREKLGTVAFTHFFTYIFARTGREKEGICKTKETI